MVLNTALQWSGRVIQQTQKQNGNVCLSLSQKAQHPRTLLPKLNCQDNSSFGLFFSDELPFSSSRK